AKSPLALWFDFLLDLRKIDCDIFEFEKCLSLEGQVQYLIRCSLLDDFMELMCYLPDVRAYSKRYGGHRFIRYLIARIDDLKIEPLVESWSKGLSEHEMALAIAQLNAWAQVLQNDMHTCTFKTEPVNSDLCDQNQWHSMIELIEYAFMRYRKVMVMRVDLGYKSECQEGITYEQAKNDMHRFLSSRRNSQIFEHEVGMAWKLERGVAFHFHTLWLFNGHQVHKHAYKAEQICDRWIRMTNGQGLAYNCNAHIQQYKKVGIGMIERNSSIGQEYLRQAAQYLCKEDPLVRAYTPSGFRIFGRSLLT
ncbi:MAG: YagK/YfjJ domain-containing protein, partial [Saezia sp.]